MPSRKRQARPRHDLPGAARDARGRFISWRAIVARAASQARERARQAETRRRAAAGRKGWETRRTREAAEAKARAAKRRAFQHGKAAREATETRLSPAQRKARTREAQRIERRAKRARPKAIAPRPRHPRRPEAPILDSPTWTEEPEEEEEAPEPRERSRRLTTLTTSSATTTETSTTPTPRSRPTSRTATTSSRDGLRVQMSVRARLPAGLTLSNRLLNEAIAYRVEHGADHPSFTTRILRWQNPGRKRAELRAWRQGNQPDAWATLGSAILAAVERAG